MKYASVAFLIVLVLQPGAVAQAETMAPMKGMGAMATEAGGPSATVGSLTLSAGAVKAMLPGARVGGGGLTITNGGGDDDRLVSVESPFAGAVEIHTMEMDGEVMKMRKLDGGLVLPAGQTVTLSSGGLHLMFLDVKTPFQKGGKVPVTLIFEKAGKVDYSLSIGTAGDK